MAGLAAAPGRRAYRGPDRRCRPHDQHDERTARRGVLISIAFWVLFDFLTTTAGLYARAVLPADQFGEGITRWGHQIIGVTWQNGVGHRWSIKDLKPIKNGLGISILSTPKGVMSDTAARDANVGGEVLLRVY